MGYFLFFFCSGRGGGVQGARTGGDRYLLKIPGERGGVVSKEGEGLGGCLWRVGEFGGGALIFFFRGRNVTKSTFAAVNELIGLFKVVQKVVLANVPSFRCFGTIVPFLNPRSGLGTVVPFFVPSFRFWGLREHSPNQTFGNHPFAGRVYAPEACRHATRVRRNFVGVCPLVLQNLCCASLFCTGGRAVGRRQIRFRHVQGLFANFSQYFILLSISSPIIWFLGCSIPLLVDAIS